jgi:hypothetical protein
MRSHDSTGVRRWFVWFAGTALYLGASYLLLLLAFRQIDGFRVELGGSDEAFRPEGDRAWSRSYPDHGPYRIRRGQRRMTDFLARMAHEGAELEIPARIDRGGAELLIRGHRYGQPGVVHVLAGGVRLKTLVYRKDSYPWDVERLPVPETLAGSPLRVDFLGAATVEDVDLPPGGLLGIDWVEVQPLDPDGRFVPTFRQWLFASILPLFVFASLRWAGVRCAFAAGFLSGAILLAAHALAPGRAVAATGHFWVIVPTAALFWVVLRHALKVEPIRARRLTALGSLTILGHAPVIFFPNHQPPDLRAHLGQVARLDSFRLDQFWEFSSTTPVAGHNKPATGFDQDYVAPYPPWSYFLVHALRPVKDNPRFWMEWLGLVAAGAIVLLTERLARDFAGDAKTAAYAAALMAVEIATWHHASRAHTPTMLGQLSFLAAVAYLVANHDQMKSPRALFGLGFFSFLACVAYPGSLIHWVILLGCFLVVELVARRSLLPSPDAARALLASAAGGVASIAAFYHPFVWAAIAGRATRQAILLREVFRPKATFFFLRNQMRDTVEILSFGYPLWVLLGVPALLRLRAWAHDPFARKMIWSWLAAYTLHLILKDPVFFPQLFLYVKEELMYAPLACILGGVTLAWLDAKGRLGRATAYGVVLLCLGLYVQDFHYNADAVAAMLSREE